MNVTAMLLAACKEDPQQALGTLEFDRLDRVVAEQVGRHER